MIAFSSVGARQTLWGSVLPCCGRGCHTKEEIVHRYGTLYVVCIYGWLKRPQTSKNKIVLSCMLEVERALVSGLVTQRIADLHEKTAGKHSVLMLPSAYMTCLIQLRENNAKGLGSECKARDPYCDLQQTWHSSSGIYPEPLYQVSPKSHF